VNQYKKTTINSNQLSFQEIDCFWESETQSLTKEDALNHEPVETIINEELFTC
jgi:hypothetical protein